MSLVKEAPLTTGLERGMREIVDRLARAAMVVAPPVLRIALAVPFFRSGLTRWDGFLSLSPSAAYLFEEEFKLHIFGGEYGFPAPIVIAYIVGTEPRVTVAGVP